MRRSIIRRAVQSADEAGMISESDWRKLKKIREKALETLCGRALKAIGEAIDGIAGSNHEKYIYVSRLVQNYDNHIALIAGDQRRSKAEIQLVLMQSEGLIDASDRITLSQALQEFLKNQR